MAKGKSERKIEQLGFDFEFNETIATIERIQDDAIRDDDLIQGENDAGRTNATAGRGQASTDFINGASDRAKTVQPAGLEDRGSMGDELPGAAAQAGERGGNGASEPIVGATEFGSASAGGSGRRDDTRDGGTRDPGNESGRDRTE
ncbi:hypothetical protein ACFQAT_28670 [Undibacterium arcticum]|uniref:Uncharacterized protein n=1 Tax=Undibacterium arcticum TaxID=1762892 RepID=A0ABV7F9Z6_9BURK